LARAAVHLAAGLDGCRELTEQNWFAEIRNVVIQLGRESPSGVPAVLLIAQQQVFKSDLSEHVEILLQMMALWYRDMIYALTGRQDRLVFPDQADWFAKQAPTRGVDGWVRAMELALAAVRRIRANVQPQLALEQFLVNVREG
jgi:DNA polymerase-3 subunit delta'